MKAIKFRVYDTKNKTMIYMKNLSFFYDQGIHEIIDGVGEGKDNTYELMQYINQIDSKGRDIYEGDIVTWYSPLIETGKKMIGIVIYDIRRAAFVKCPIGLFRSDFNKCNGIGSDFKWYETLEVQGNIHENGELLIF
ncbi:TPA: YopX family protein [Bacillus cereus]